MQAFETPEESVVTSVETGDWSLDNATGRALAREIIETTQASCAPLALSRALKEIVRSGRWGGVEVGFVTAIATAII